MMYRISVEASDGNSVVSMGLDYRGNFAGARKRMVEIVSELRETGKVVTGLSMKPII